MKTVKMQLAAFQNHIGHCQLTYYSRNDEGQRLVYCLQDNIGIRLMRCTQEGEPMYDVKFIDVIAEFERPKPQKYDSEYALKLKQKCNEWIDNYEQNRKL